MKNLPRGIPTIKSADEPVYWNPELPPKQAQWHELQQTLRVQYQDTTGTVFKRSAEANVGKALQTIDAIEAGTLILTTTGLKAVEALRYGDKVASSVDEFDKVFDSKAIIKGHFHKLQSAVDPTSQIGFPNAAPELRELTKMEKEDTVARFLSNTSTDLKHLIYVQLYREGFRIDDSEKAVKKIK